jgi:hypothetical protein
MKKILLTLSAIAATALAAQAQTTIANWTFEPDPLPTNVTNSAIGPFSATVGTGSVTGLHASNNTVWNSPSGNGSANSLSANSWTSGDYFQFQFSTLAFSNIAITWSQTRSGTGPTNFSLRYSTDGTSFTSFTNYSVAQVTWNSTSNNLASIFTSDLSSITELNAQTDVYLRLVSDQTAASAGTGRIDDVTITGVPEPSTYAMLALAGAGFAGYVIRRRRR